MVGPYRRLLAIVDMEEYWGGALQIELRMWPGIRKSEITSDGDGQSDFPFFFTTQLLAFRDLA